ncbi:phosphodiester glycosidase family protein [Aquibacillus albus]|uniref:Exopolysaccharide biosynthesis protein n=1 Tax=Aquibacillus albus TaxID=1168171 RepID=A0ABS2MWJ7_9BACI|nr:phosphodiester glycosidase family protein [Aquibacillus albus]MBM7570264.1 exopolysaccharide biosynthesis protein [Aquibacillus albus]
MKQKLLRVTAIYGLVLMLFFSCIPIEIHAQNKSFTVSPGITYEQTNTTYDGMKEQVNVLKIDLNNEYAGVELGIPDPLDKLMRTTQQARINHEDGHRIVGAINASFFTFDRKLPMYLLARNNQILNTGILSTNKDSYVSEPIAFGVDAEGKAKIDHFELDMSFSHNNESYEFYSIDYPRFEQKIYLYTPNYGGEKLDTNEYGMEFLIENTGPTPFDSMEIGQPIEGKVTDIRKYGESRQFTIPDNGFIISAGGGALASELTSIKIGDPITINTAIDDGWKNGEFMLGSGPMLVNDGKVDLSINPDSSRAKEVAPRSAVAIDKDKNQVFFVTVDGRSSTSKGMNLTQFANYLKSLGVDQALNLDGGGSTTMALRPYGYEYVTVMNKPSDGYERSVSASLQAISYAPTGSPHTLLMEPFVAGSVLKGATITLNPETIYLLDKYYNNLSVDPSKFQLRLTNGIGSLTNQTYRATSEGKATIVVNYEGASTTQTIQVVSQPSTVKLLTESTVYHEEDVAELDVQALDSAGKAIQFNSDQVKWSTPSELEQISPGKFRVTTSKKKTVQVSAELGGKKATMKLYLNPTSLLMEDFENVKDWEAKGTNASTSVSDSKGFEPAAVGDGSLKLVYNYHTGTGTAANYITPNNPIPVQGIPEYIGMWVYGDSNKGWLRGKLIDSNGKEHYLNFTEYNDLTWQGWKYVKAPVPDSVVGPLKLNSIYLVQTDSALKTNGSIFIDQVESIYQESYQPTLQVDRVYKTASANKTWTVEFNTRIDETTLTSDHVYVVDENGSKVKVTVQLDATRQKLMVKPASNYAKHDFYKLVISKNVQSLSGLPMQADKEMIFQVK